MKRDKASHVVSQPASGSLWAVWLLALSLYPGVRELADD